MTAFLTDIYSRPFTDGWGWQVEHAERSGDVIWYIAPSEAALAVALFNGSEPGDD